MSSYRVASAGAVVATAVLLGSAGTAQAVLPNKVVSHHYRSVHLHHALNQLKAAHNAAKGNHQAKSHQHTAHASRHLELVMHHHRTTTSTQAQARSGLAGSIGM